VLESNNHSDCLSDKTMKYSVCSVQLVISKFIGNIRSILIP
jgi:hypothetical protein